MNFYTKHYDKSIETIEKHKRTNEKVLVSQPIEIDGVNYREIVYKKKFNPFKGKDINGIIFIDQNNDMVSDNVLIQKLCYIAYKVESIFSTKSIRSFEKFIQSEKDFEIKKIEYNQMITCLDVFDKENIEGCTVIIGVLEKLIDAKRENQQAVNDLLKKIKSYNTDELIFNEELIKEIEPYYINVYLKNFECIKILNEGRDYYENVRRKFDKQKTKLTNVIMSSAPRGNFAVLDNFIETTISVLLLYDEVINLDSEGYVSYFNSVESEKINKKIKMIRN